jgi:hypothetical protein
LSGDDPEDGWSTLPKDDTPYVLVGGEEITGGSKARVRAARRRLRDKKMLLSPTQRGEAGCLLAMLRVSTVAAALFVIAAPCTAGIPLGLVGAIGGLITGALVGVPLVVIGARNIEVAWSERRLAALERPKLPESSSGGGGTPVAVGSAIDGASDRSDQSES